MMNTGLDMPVAGWIQTMGEEATSVGVYPRQVDEERTPLRGLRVIRRLRRRGAVCSDTAGQRLPGG